ncbi:MAG TPA: Ig-like domain-containing protein, partial [Thermoanaerobaculia bacterium]|nr:Ig-like domain-containing protein [Thermoanaerobaculia bacterium]
GGAGDGTLGDGGGGYSSVEAGSTLMLLAGGGGGRGLGPNGTTQEGFVGSGGQGGLSATFGRTGRDLDAHGATLGGGAGGASGGSGDGASGDGGQLTGTTACGGGASAGSSGAAGSSLAGGGGAPGAGGGGGGGYVGGGQGGGGASDACGNSAGAGGGGGGSSYAAPGVSAEFAGGVRIGDGQVLIAYSNPIQAADRSYTTGRNQQLDVPVASGVLSGAVGPAGVPLTATVVSPPAHGALALDGDGSFTYAPADSYAGGDSFTFRVADPSGSYATAKATLRVAVPPSASIVAPSAGGTYVVGQWVRTAFSCSEGAGGTGLASCEDSSGAKTKNGGLGHLETSTAGLHTYTVTAVSKTGMTGSASIGYRVVPASPWPPAPEVPPSDPGEPPARMRISLGTEESSLPELLRTGKLVVATRVSEAAQVTLTGGTRLKARAGRKPRLRFVALFTPEAVRFGAPGERAVALELSPRGRRVLRRLRALRLVIVGRATDAGGEAATRRVALSLRR